MTREDAIKWMENLKSDIGQMQFRALWDYEQAMAEIINLLSAETEWIPLSHDGLGTDFPYERDGEWVIVTNGSAISVERIKKDAYDHFLPDGRWFELEDVIAWLPLPKPYGERREP